jgi:hypothetical protein
MRHGLLLAIVLGAALSITALANAAGGKLKCFADSPATCTLNSSTSATLDTTNGGDAGVYLSNGKATGGTPVANAGFSFQYFCANTIDYTSCVGGGAPRWSIPINVGNDPKDTQQVYAFLDANGCGDDGTVSTAAADCTVTLNSGGSYANWAAFAAANPTYTIANACRS